LPDLAPCGNLPAVPLVIEPRRENRFLPSRPWFPRLEEKSGVALDVEEATGRPRLLAVVPLTPEIRIGLFVANSPLASVDPDGRAPDTSCCNKQKRDEGAATLRRQANALGKKLSSVVRHKSCNI
jgi:hypothetical protein